MSSDLPDHIASGQSPGSAWPPRMGKIHLMTASARTAAAAHGGEQMPATCNGANAMFNGAAILLDDAARAGREVVSTTVDDLVVPTPTHIIPVQKTMTRSHEPPKVKSKAKEARLTTSTIEDNPQKTITAGRSARDGTAVLSSGGIAPIYASLPPGFSWETEGKVTTSTTTILVKIRMKVCILFSPAYFAAAIVAHFCVYYGSSMSLVESIVSILQYHGITISSYVDLVHTFETRISYRFFTHSPTPTPHTSLCNTHTFIKGCHQEGHWHCNGDDEEEKG
jgi:hypothetical protein